MSSLHSPTHPRSARSTPAPNVSAFSPPGDTTPEEEAERPGSSPTAPLEPAVTRGSDSDRALHASVSHDGLRPRAGSRAGGSTPAPAKGHVRRGSHEPDPLQYSSSFRSQRARLRDDWDFDYDGGRDYPPMRDYDRYWRADPRLDRYTSRRGPFPPPTYLNRGGRHAMLQDSDEEAYHDDPRYVKDAYESTRMRRPTDEEMGLGPGPMRRRGSDLHSALAVTRLDWNHLTPEEKKEVMRIPLTQWMNSDFKNHLVATLGELVGTTMFLFFAFAGTEVANIQSRAQSQNTTTGETTGFDIAVLLYISLIFGFSLMVNVWIFFRISGGLFNPAVTLAMVLVRGVSVVRGVCLFFAQMCGGLLASVIVRFLFPEQFNVRTTLGQGTSIAQGVFIEALLTAELVFTIFMLAKEKHRATFIAPVGIGLALFIAEMAGVQFTGGSLNPARSFGPCVVTHTFDSEHWIYWVGPFIGSLIACMFYRFIKTLEYEMANPGADGDDFNDPTKNPEKRAEIQIAKSASKPPSVLG